jgi:hypothetical protein
MASETVDMPPFQEPLLPATVRGAEGAKALLMMGRGISTPNPLWMFILSTHIRKKNICPPQGCTLITTPPLKFAPSRSKGRCTLVVLQPRITPLIASSSDAFKHVLG